MPKNSLTGARLNKRSRSPKEGRGRDGLCVDCKKQLNTYNPTPRCWQCTQAFSAINLLDYQSIQEMHELGLI